MTYEYVCAGCGHQWEAEQSISEAPLKTCPACKAERAKRQVSGGQGFILKGGGWYADGYGAKGSSSGGSTSSGGTGSTRSGSGGTGSGGSSAAKSESKAATA